MLSLGCLHQFGVASSKQHDDSCSHIRTVPQALLETEQQIGWWYIRTPLHRKAFLRLSTSGKSCCAVTGFQSHTKNFRLKTVQQIKSRIWEMKGLKQICKDLAAIQFSAIFYMRDIRGSDWTPCWCPPGWVTTWWLQTKSNICC